MGLTIAGMARMRDTAKTGLLSIYTWRKTLPIRERLNAVFYTNKINVCNVYSVMYRDRNMTIYIY